MVISPNRAVYRITVDGREVTDNLTSILLSLDVSLSATGETDSARFDLDDTNGMIAIPDVGKAVSIALGWVGRGARTVFEGTVDEVRSSGSRSGRTISISAKGFDAIGGSKGSKNRHWDDSTVATILGDAASTAGLDGADVDPGLSSIVIGYWAMIDESVLHMGQRLAQKIGGHFRISGRVAVMSSRGPAYAPIATAFWGRDLISWDVTPGAARKQFGEVRAPWFDRAAGVMRHETAKTGLKSKAVLTIDTCADQADAKRQAKARAETSARDAAVGRVRVDGNPAAVGDGQVELVGARPGGGGRYRIKAVRHSITRGGGFVTDIEIGQPQS